MLVFGRRFLQARDKYIIPLISYSVPENKLEFNNIKYALLNFIKYTRVTGSRYELYFEKDSLLKALVGDIEYFYTKTIVQYCNLLRAQNNLSACWRIVTQYYFSFFSVTTLLRFLHRGHTYLDGDQAKRISDILTLFSEHGLTVIKRGNYKFYIEQTTNPDELCLVLIQSDTSHDQTWNLVSEVLSELLADSTRDDEYTILMTLKKIINCYQYNFPSTLRNQVNYQAKYGLESIKNQLQFYKITDLGFDEVVNQLLLFDNKTDENYKLKISGLYGYYFFALISKFYSEYITRSRSSNSLDRIRKEYLKRYGVFIPDFPDSI